MFIGLLKNILVPLIVCIAALTLIYYAVKTIFRLFGLDIVLFKVLGVLAIWYFVGPYIYDWLEEVIIITPNEAIKVLFMPIQSFLALFDKLR